jgi:hypothetical protein
MVSKIFSLMWAVFTLGYLIFLGIIKAPFISILVVALVFTFQVVIVCDIWIFSPRQEKELKDWQEIALQQRDCLQAQSKNLDEFKAAIQVLHEKLYSSGGGH